MPTWWDSIPDTIHQFILQQPVFFVASAPIAGKYVNVSPKGHPSRTFAIMNPNQVAYLDFVGSASETASHIYENGRVTMLFCSFLESPRIVRLFTRGRIIERDSPEFRPFIEQMRQKGMKIEPAEEKTKAKISQELEHQKAVADGTAEPGPWRKFRPRDIDMRPDDGLGVLGCRAVIVLDVWRVQKSCGFGVPLLMAGPDGGLVEGPDKNAEVESAGGEDSGYSSGHDEDRENGLAKETVVDGKERSQDIYSSKGSVQFDRMWDDRLTMDKWARMMVGSGGIMKYRRDNNLTSLDGLPGMKSACVDQWERLEIELSAWARRTFIWQWQTLVVGMLLALFVRWFGGRLVEHLLA